MQWRSDIQAQRFPRCVADRPASARNARGCTAEWNYCVVRNALSGITRIFRGNAVRNGALDRAQKLRRLIPSEIQRRGIAAQRLVREKEKKPVLHNRSANAARPLIEAIVVSLHQFV